MQPGIRHRNQQRQYFGGKAAQMALAAIQHRDIARRGAPAAKRGYYNFYLLDNEGKVYSAASMHCHDDIDAVEKAPFELQRSAWYPVIEIWQGRRLVERIGNRLPS
jgi:hypothetical protein